MQRTKLKKNFESLVLIVSGDYHNYNCKKQTGVTGNVIKHLKFGNYKVLKEYGQL